MLTCLYPAGEGFDLPVTAIVGNQSSAPGPDATLSYVDLSGERTVNTTMAIAINRTVYVYNEKAEAWGWSFNHWDDGTARMVQEGVTAWMEASEEAIALEEGGSIFDFDAYIIPDSVVECDDEDLEDYITEYRFKPCEDGYTHLLKLVILASGVYEEGKIRTLLTNKNATRHGATGFFDSHQVERIEFQSVSFEWELYCPPGQQGIEDAQGKYICGECIRGEYNMYKDRTGCLLCPEGSNCDEKGTVVPVSLKNWWRKNPWSVEEAGCFSNYYEGWEVRFDLFHYSFYKCLIEGVCHGGINSTCSGGHVHGAPLCAVCEAGIEGEKEGELLTYYLVQGHCLLCGDSGNVQAGIAMVLCVALMSTVAFTMWFLQVDMAAEEADGEEEDDAQKSSNRATKLKMLLSYLQVFGDGGGLDIPWPKSFERMQSSANSVVAANPVDMPVLNAACAANTNFYATFSLMIIVPPVMCIYFFAAAQVGHAWLAQRGRTLGIMPWVARRKLAQVSCFVLVVRCHHH